MGNYVNYKKCNRKFNFTKSLTSQQFILSYKVYNLNFWLEKRSSIKTSNFFSSITVHKSFPMQTKKVFEKLMTKNVKIKSWLLTSVNQFITNYKRKKFQFPKLLVRNFKLIENKPFFQIKLQTYMFFHIKFDIKSNKV